MTPANRRDLLRELEHLGFESSQSGPQTIVRFHGDVFARLPARLPARLYDEILKAAERHLRENGLAAPRGNHSHPSSSAVQLHRPVVLDAPTPPAADAAAADLVALRWEATVDSLGRPRAERVAAWRRYREAFRERFGRYPGERTTPGVRPVFGRCPECEQPEELNCLAGCRMIDRLETIWPPATRPRGPRPWSSTRPRPPA